jgi:hypothetical protein
MLGPGREFFVARIGMTGCAFGGLYPTVYIVAIGAVQFFGIVDAFIVIVCRLAVAFCASRLCMFFLMGKSCNLGVAIGAGDALMRHSPFKFPMAIGTGFVCGISPEWRGEKEN